jgi:hypothetical protein
MCTSMTKSYNYNTWKSHADTTCSVVSTSSTYRSCIYIYIYIHTYAYALGDNDLAVPYVH